MHLRLDDGSQHHTVAQPEVPAHAVTRRRLVHRLGGLLGGVVAIGAQPFASNAKRRKRKKKKQQSLKAHDWDGFWTTRLSSGVSGSVNLSYDTTLDILYGTYSNSVGNGELRCYAERADPFSCAGRYDQTDGSGGQISMNLTSEKRWDGTYQIDDGEGGTWSGVR